MKRLFIAIKINPEDTFREVHSNLRGLLRSEKITWVSPENIHITLKFLGDTEEARIPAIMEAMRKSAEGIPPFSFHLKGTGIFGSSYQPKVVWIGVPDGSEMVTLAKKLIDAMVPLGWPRDRQNFVPHLTIGRIRFIRDKAAFQQAIDEYRSEKIQEVQVDDIRLYESILKREGPEYKMIAKAGLVEI